MNTDHPQPKLNVWGDKLWYSVTRVTANRADAGFLFHIAI